MDQTLGDLRDALRDGNVRAFLRAIRHGETSAEIDDAYHALYGWARQTGRPRFDDLTTHPKIAIKSAWGWTSAAGAYQAMAAVPGQVRTDTWGDWVRWCAPQAFVPTMSYADQDLFAIWCIARRHALPLVIAGQFDRAIELCSYEWASLPGNPYGQPALSLQDLRAVYVKFGGIIGGRAKERAQTDPVPTPPPTIDRGAMGPGEALPTPEPRSKPMAPILAAVLPSIVQAIPTLAKLFGSGSEVAERNIKAAETVIGIVQQATGAVNAQAAAEAVASDPDLRVKAQQAVADQWWTITEAGGGGIEGARKADAAAAAAGTRPWQSPALIVTGVLVPLVYIALYAVLFVPGYSDEIKAMVLGAVFGGLLTGGITAFWFGTSASSQRKTDALAARG